MEKRTVFYVEFLAPGVFVGETWCVDVPTLNPAAVAWPDNAYAFRLFQRDEVVDGDQVLRGTAKQVGPLYYHPDSVVQSLDEVRKNPAATPILLDNMRINEWPQVVWTRWGNWPQAFDRDTMQVLAGTPTYPAAFAVHTVQGITYACQRHASALVHLMAVMGANSLPEPLDVNDPHECSNCVNEAKSKARTTA